MWDCSSSHIGLDSQKNPISEYMQMQYTVSFLTVGISEWTLLGYKLNIPDHATAHHVSLATRHLGIA